jgi:hypothetical protein
MKRNSKETKQNKNAQEKKSDYVINGQEVNHRKTSHEI